MKINPHLPSQWECVKFRFYYKGERSDFDVTKNAVKIRVKNEKNIEINAEFRGTPIKLRSGEEYRLQ